MQLVVWLIAVLVGVTYWTWNDTRQYRQFVAERDSGRRRAFYWRWTMQSFGLLTLASLVTLGLLGRFDALLVMPAEFEALRIARQGAATPPTDTPDARLGFYIGVALASAVAIAIWARRVRTMLTPVIAEVAPLIPRNAAERWAALPLCINAGYSEELFFRLALPLLLTHVTGSVAAGTAIAVVLFGFIHWYQGWKGIVGTMLVGALMTLVYVTSGSLVRVMVTHALIDVVGLIIRPMIGQLVARRRASALPSEA
ncbi:MAG: CPBP family intramembrane metalloprotease [Gemmatimonadaceae bacterium]|jgi:membrane protease YdiL (CAAX protease family)|nr:CPBP family intramembrane metalloprotease [Gemmatimonadaceae bacterium]